MHSSPPLELIRLEGTHLEIGRRYGEACQSLIHEHLALALERLDQVGIPRALALETARSYRPFVREHASFLDEEIRGLAEGSGLDEDEAYLLQLRAEVFADVLGETRWGNECTTFAVEPELTTTGRALAGQNADLPEIYRRLLVVVDIVPDSGSRVLMVVPAGQVSYIGINDRGLAVFANYLHCRGWAKGFPRYLLSRLALEHDSAAEALATIEALPRASSRNLLMLDPSGSAIDFENTPTTGATLLPDAGLLLHTNHYLSAELADAESAPAANSRTRSSGSVAWRS